MLLLSFLFLTLAPAARSGQGDAFFGIALARRRRAVAAGAEAQLDADDEFAAFPAQGPRVDYRSHFRVGHRGVFLIHFSRKCVFRSEMWLFFPEARPKPTLTQHVSCFGV